MSRDPDTEPVTIQGIVIKRKVEKLRSYADQGTTRYREDWLLETGEFMDLPDLKALRTVKVFANVTEAQLVIKSLPEGNYEIQTINEVFW